MSRRVLSCCEPFYVAFPSGYSWLHSRSCPERSLLKVEPEEWIWTDEEYPEVEQQRHEAQAHADLDENGCPVHNGYQPWNLCPGCMARLEAEFA